MGKLSKRICLYVFFFLVFWSTLLGALIPSFNSVEAADSSAQELEIVRGRACYSYGDKETPDYARRTATDAALEQAVRKHRVFVKSSSTVRNLQLEEDVIHTMSAGMLEQLNIENVEKNGQEVCVTVSGKLSPVSLEELIQQRAKAKQDAQIAQAPILPQSPGYGLRVWVDKPDGRYIEGDRVVVYVQAEQDSYLKLDYFMADGCVLHLVPNPYRGQAFMRGGQTYSFGGDADPEHIVITPPFGAETIKAVMTASPILAREDDNRRGCDDSRDYLKRLESGVKAGTRGATLTGVDRSVALVTTSKAVDGYRKRKEGS
jgi:hypothetical protein